MGSLVSKFRRGRGGEEGVVTGGSAPGSRSSTLDRETKMTTVELRSSTLPRGKTEGGSGGGSHKHSFLPPSFTRGKKHKEESSKTSTLSNQKEGEPGATTEEQGQGQVHEQPEVQEVVQAQEATVTSASPEKQQQEQQQQDPNESGNFLSKFFRRSHKDKKKDKKDTKEEEGAQEKKEDNNVVSAVPADGDNNVVSAAPADAEKVATVDVNGASPNAHQQATPERKRYGSQDPTPLVDVSKLESCAGADTPEKRRQFLIPASYLPPYRREEDKRAAKLGKGEEAHVAEESAESAPQGDAAAAESAEGKPEGENALHIDETELAASGKDVQDEPKPVEPTELFIEEKGEATEVKESSAIQEAAQDAEDTPSPEAAAEEIAPVHEPVLAPQIEVEQEAAPAPPAEVAPQEQAPAEDQITAEQVESQETVPIVVVSDAELTAATTIEDPESEQTQMAVPDEPAAVHSGSSETTDIQPEVAAEAPIAPEKVEEQEATPEPVMTENASVEEPIAPVDIKEVESVPQVEVVSDDVAPVPEADVPSQIETPQEQAAPSTVEDEPAPQIVESVPTPQPTAEVIVEAPAESSPIVEEQTPAERDEQQQPQEVEQAPEVTPSGGSEEMVEEPSPITQTQVLDTQAPIIAATPEATEHSTDEVHTEPQQEAVPEASPDERGQDQALPEPEQSTQAIPQEAEPDSQVTDESKADNPPEETKDEASEPLQEEIQAPAPTDDTAQETQTTAAIVESEIETHAEQPEPEQHQQDQSETLVQVQQGDGSGPSIEEPQHLQEPAEQSTDAVPAEEDFDAMALEAEALVVQTQSVPPSEQTEATQEAPPQEGQHQPAEASATTGDSVSQEAGVVIQQEQVPTEVQTGSTKQEWPAAKHQDAGGEFAEAQAPSSPNRVSTEFVWEHGGTKVSVSGTFNNWDEIPMDESDGMFKVSLELPRGRHHYHYTVDGDNMANPMEDMEEDVNVLNI